MKTNPKTPATNKSPDWENLLNQALTEPGIISSCYSRFHGYSFANQLLAGFQLAAKGLPMAPIATYKKWAELGRQVRKGEKALSLYIPATAKKKDEDGNEKEGDIAHFFVMRPLWFSLDQTDSISGEEYSAPAVDIGWDKAKALASLGITEVPFHYMDGNAQGFARGNGVAVNPVAVLPHKTLFHEIAHVVLGHTGEGDEELRDDEALSRSVREVEAESTAYLCCAALELPGLTESRGYIQSWLSSAPLPEKSMRRIFSAANKILAAGSSKPE